MQTAHDEEEPTTGCFSGMQSRLASLWSRRHRSSAGAQQIPSAPASPSTLLRSSMSNHAQGQTGPSAPYVPQYAGASFSKTATSRQMRKENEILLLSSPTQQDICWPFWAAALHLTGGPRSKYDQTKP
ncbi:hypothetical protein F4777DRAFT_581899 [Nemania sp. FL0916]|nr:hypothetical protein F4777DRAFT_581899 [Nemania sp. FL0916]